MPDDFDLPDQEALAALARNAAIAIANARLRDDLKKTQIDLAKALEAAAIEEAVAGRGPDARHQKLLFHDCQRDAVARKA
jgi:GAF domain-containing protein